MGGLLGVGGGAKGMLSPPPPRSYAYDAYSAPRSYAYDAYSAHRRKCKKKKIVHLIVTYE